MDPTVCKFCALWSTVPCITCVVLRAVQAVDAPNGALATAGCEACLHCSRVTAKNQSPRLVAKHNKGKIVRIASEFRPKKNMKTQKKTPSARVGACPCQGARTCLAERGPTQQRHRMAGNQPGSGTHHAKPPKIRRSLAPWGTKTLKESISLHFYLRLDHSTD